MCSEPQKTAEEQKTASLAAGHRFPSNVALASLPVLRSTHLGGLCFSHMKNDKQVPGGTFAAYMTNIGPGMTPLESNPWL